MYPDKDVVGYENKRGVHVTCSADCRAVLCVIPASWVRVSKNKESYFKKGYMIIFLGKVLHRETLSDCSIPLVLKNRKAAENLLVTEKLNNIGGIIVKICGNTPYTKSPDA